MHLYYYAVMGALQALRRNVLRAALTCLGIVIDHHDPQPALRIGRGGRQPPITVRMRSGAHRQLHDELAALIESGAARVDVTAVQRDEAADEGQADSQPAL